MKLARTKADTAFICVMIGPKILIKNHFFKEVLFADSDEKKPKEK
jgi:hypothetical protein